MENAKPNISPRRGMTPLERAWAAALCASGDAVANMGTDALRLAAAQKPRNVTSAGIMESTHKLARACRIIDVSTASTPAAQKAADAYALEAALYAVAYEAARLVRSDMWPLVAMRLDAAQEVGTRTSDLHIRQPLGKLIMRRHPLAVRGSTAQNLVEELLYAAAKRGRRRQDWANTLEAAVACGCMMDAVLSYPPQWEDTNQWKQEN